MFVVDAAVLLPHPPHAVARVVGRLRALPRWCTGLRGVPAAAGVATTGIPPTTIPAVAVAATAVASAECAFTYTGVDLRLVLAARTLAVADGVVRHEARGDGVTFTWTLAAEAESGVGSGPGAWTRLRARTTVEVDPDHPTAAVRSALCRLVARRAPLDLDRLGAFIARGGPGAADATAAARAAMRRAGAPHASVRAALPLA
jgi:hypothetical protein